MSKKIEDFIPPLELCKRIPEGMFTESVFCWLEYNREGWVRSWRNIRCPYDAPWIIAPRFSAVEAKFHPAEAPNNLYPALFYPAPTQEEILLEMAKNPRYFNNGYCEIDGDGFIVGAFLPNLGNPGSTLVEYRDQNGATAALKLFLHRREQ